MTTTTKQARETTPEPAGMDVLCREHGCQTKYLDERIDRMHTALQRIADWAEAYPLDIFPEPDFKKARELLKAGGITLDAISASNMRHLITRVAAIASAALRQPGLRS